MYDITLTGSLVNGAYTQDEALELAKTMSEIAFPGRLLRVHGVDGETVIAEYRDGRALELV